MQAGRREKVPLNTTGAGKCQIALLRDCRKPTAAGTKRTRDRMGSEKVGKIRSEQILWTVLGALS